MPEIAKVQPNHHLREERLRHQWSQQEVADCLGTTTNNVSRWELGQTRPGPYFRAKLCELFERQPWELGLLTTRTSEEDQLPTTAAPNVPDRALLVAKLDDKLWYVPYPRNPFFTGRDQILQSLHEALKEKNLVTSLTQSHALNGLGGIGKTQIALEYVYRYVSAYPAIFWMNAETYEALLTSFVSIADLLNLPERDEQDQHKLVSAVKRWLGGQKDWLLVFDNVEDLALLQAFLPSSRQGSLLMTTRLQAVGTVAQQITVDSMNTEEGMNFLLYRAKLLRPGASPMDFPSADLLVAQEIVEATNGLPLALDQAGAYIEETQCNLSDYLQLYSQRRSLLLGRRGHGSQDHPASVRTSLSLSFQQVEQRSPIAADVLRLCAFLAPDFIPEELILVGSAACGEQLQALATEPWLLDEVIRVLRMYSLIHRDAANRTLSVHRLMQAVLQDSLSEREREEWMKRVIVAINYVFPEVDQDTLTLAKKSWEQCERLVAHALQCARQTLSWEQTDKTLAALLCKTGIYLLERAQYEEAEQLVLRALQIEEQVSGTGHSDMIIPLHFLGHLSYLQGRYVEAQQWYLRALQIGEQTLGPLHPQIACMLNGLANQYLKQGKYREAQSLYERTLQIREQALEANHPKVVSSSCNLAIVYAAQGKYAEAELLFQKVLDFEEQGDPYTLANTLSNLGLLYQEQGKYKEAELVLERALRLWESVLDVDHPQLAYVLTNLGLVYQEQARYSEAEALLMRALQIREQKLGAGHPSLIRTFHAVGSLYLKQRKYMGAEQMLNKALHFAEQLLGADNSDVAYPLVSLAQLCCEQQRYEEAKPFYERAWRIREQELGSDHPLTAESLYDLESFSLRYGAAEETKK